MGRCLSVYSLLFCHCNKKASWPEATYRRVYSVLQFQRNRSPLWWEVQQQAAGLAAGARSWEFTSSESGKLHKQGEAIRLQACPSYTLLSKASSPDPSQAVPLGPKSSNICIYGRHFSFIPPQLFFLFPKKQTLLYILYSCPVSSQRFLLLHLIVLQDLGFFFFLVL